MPRNSDQESEKTTSGRQSRRNFLAKFGLGAAALAAGAAVPLFRQRKSADKAALAPENEFPGEDSIFHPASDPRQDPRRKT